MPNHDFHAPDDLRQACALLADASISPLAIAGGTDIMVRFNRHRRRREETLVHLGKLGLDYIREESGRVVVGACAPLAAVAESALVRAKLPLLAKACGDMASPAIRNAGTLGGNVVNNARHADGVAALTALDAQVVIASTQGERAMAMAEFAAAPKREALADGGLVRHFVIAPLGPDEKWAWEKMRMRKGESRSVVSVSFRATHSGGKFAAARLVVGCMAANPFVSQAAAGLLKGQALSAGLIEQVVAGVLAECDPVNDARATAWYRQQAAAALIRRILSQLL
ncbi:MAG: FAD binding domain-containing protein [Pseudomonadota bacterium]